MGAKAPRPMSADFVRPEPSPAPPSVDAAPRLFEALGPEGVDAVLGAWLARRHRMRPRLLWAKPAAPARAPHYLAFVREQDCALCRQPGPCDPHHFGPRGLGEKADDYRCVPLCRKCHDHAHHNPADTAPRLMRAMVETLVHYLRITEAT